VRIERGATAATCVRVAVDEGGMMDTAGPVTFRPEGFVALGVAQRGTSPAVTVTATGGTGTNCASLGDQAFARGTFQFVSGEVSVGTLVLERQDSDRGPRDSGVSDAGSVGDAGNSDAGSSTDAGSDDDAGKTTDSGVTDAGAPDAGVVDAGAPDAGRDAGPLDAGGCTPRGPEICFGNLDEDCDGRIDCAQPSCDLAACGLGVDGGAMCFNQACLERDCGNGLDDNLRNGADCADVDCATRGCSPTGACFMNTCTTETQCNDTLDNNLNGLTDCADPGCDARACNDGLACRSGEVCANRMCGGGSTVSCASTQCLAGACTEPGGCTSTPTLASCSDGQRCTTADTCGVDGGCSGTPVICAQTSNVCRADQGACLAADGGCFFAPVDGGCTDPDPCVVNEGCQNGACQGTRTVCAPGACQVLGPSTCLPNGSCDVRPLDAGTLCPGGTCDGLGRCGFFPFVPSNLDPLQLPADAGPGLTISCDTTYRLEGTGPLTVTTSTMGCLAMTPSYQLVPSASDGGLPTVIISAPSMTITTGATLNLVGSSYPYLFAIRGDVTIAGTLRATPANPGGGFASGPGGNDPNLCGTSRGSDGNATEPSSGGAGGSFGTTGGRGGGTRGGAVPTVAAGPTSGNATIIPLRGGCAGGNGGPNNPGRAVGGRAGGAVQVTSAGAIVVSGTITASAQGGSGAPGGNTNGWGGGGGGSGGAVLLEARQLTVSGALTANGGGGGEGGRGNSGVNGANGSTTTATAAAGGDGNSTAGGAGGNGAAGTTGAANAANATNSGPNWGGGGGGGGGAGRIRLNVVTGCTFSGVVSPRSTSATSSCVSP